MRLQQIQNRIRELMSIFVYQVEGSVSMNQTDINRISEIVLISLFAEVFGYRDLKSLNTPQQPNFPGIDLGDETARVAIQVTASSDNAKVKDTLHQFVKQRHYEDFDKLKIYILTRKQNSYSGSGHNEIVQGKFSFNKDTDIIDYRDLLAAISNMQLSGARRVVEILEANFGSRDVVPLIDPTAHVSEEVYLNLVDVSFPDELFVADLAIDRSEVINNSWQSQGRGLLKTASTREVAQAALKQQGLSFAADWVCHANQIITFHDLYDDELPIGKIIDRGTITTMRPDRFYSPNRVVDENLERVFKSLLRRCLQQKLFHRDVQWQNEDNVFIFVETDQKLKRVEQWYGDKENERTVYERTMKNNKPDEILNCKHLAFGVQFRRFDAQWYLLINPDWFFSRDGYKRSAFAADKLKWLKREEDNKQVFNHFRFLVYFLSYEDQPGLFQQKAPYRFLKIGTIQKFGAAPVLQDEVWNPPKLSDGDDEDEAQAQLNFSL